MSELIIVEGQTCLDYIDKDVGFGSHDSNNYGNRTLLEVTESFPKVIGNQNNHTMRFYIPTYYNTLMRWYNDKTKRVVGLVLGDSPDGGLEVALLGSDTIGFNDTYMCRYSNIVSLIGTYQYDAEELPPFNWELDTQRVGRFFPYPWDGREMVSAQMYASNPSQEISFDESIDYRPSAYVGSGTQELGTIWEYAHNLTTNTEYTLTNDKNNTMVVGVVLDMQEDIPYPNDFIGNPLTALSGNLYQFAGSKIFDGEMMVPEIIPAGTDFDMIKFPFGETTLLSKTNLTSIPFNIILTRSEQYAKNYLQTGTLPPDAFLYPLDWENLPRYDEPVPTGDEPDDYPDDNKPDDDERDFDPTPNEIVSYTVNQFTNYNWYWLTVPQWSAFISWFWNDIGNYSDFDDIISKVKGLYNDVASAVIMCRYYPVDISWIGGLGTQSNIKLGMIEKAGAVDTISQANALRSVDIGHVHIGQKYKSFMDMSPYSQLSLYLPWHGFIDLDMNLFNGHDVYVKALYDYLSGTIQYYVFYDNEVLVNTILCKMAMDIPITLQTKNDRDSAIFNNVSSTIGGLVGAGAGILSGNPIGMTLGITQGVGAFNSANASAPMRLMGNVGESGAYIGCQNCFVVVRRPTIQASDGKKNNTDVDTSIDRLTTWKKNVGMLCGYGYTLSSLSGKGFTVCHSPRINFTNTAPLQSEVDEIYNYLEKGVIL